MKRTRPKASHLLAERKIPIIRYADDFVVMHEDKEIVEKANTFIAQWISKMGLELKESKTKKCHTRRPVEGEEAGFNFFGFNVRQYPTNARRKGYCTIIKPSKEGQKKHLYAIKLKIRAHRGESQQTLVRNLNPIIRGWANYYRFVSSRKVFERADHQTFIKLWRWARYRHPHKNRFWIKDRYFRKHKNDFWRFKTEDEHTLLRHSDLKIKHYVKVKGTKSPFDGDEIYWNRRKEKGKKHMKPVNPNVYKRKCVSLTDNEKNS
jgi:RNA-directed DNA polymerase